MVASLSLALELELEQNFIASASRFRGKMGIELRQIITGVLTVTMFVTLGNMILPFLIISDRLNILMKIMIQSKALYYDSWK
ncbi:hypothetical protein Lser_V15G23877 [Lactuca serriola]